jgi:hypothetical protein
MSPEKAGTIAALARLAGEIDEDRAAMRRRRADLDEAERRLGPSPSDPAALAFVAWSLHGWYTALETLLERVARQLDAEVPAGPQWHRDLLAQACVAVPKVRPAVLDARHRRDLEELLGMRHFLRHAYGADLDTKKLGEHAARLRAVDGPVQTSLDAFVRFLADAMDAAGE